MTFGLIGCNVLRMTTTRQQIETLATSTSTDVLLVATKTLMDKGELDAAENHALAVTVAELIKRGLFAGAGL